MIGPATIAIVTVATTTTVAEVESPQSPSPHVLGDGARHAVDRTTQHGLNKPDISPEDLELRRGLSTRLPVSLFDLSRFFVPTCRRDDAARRRRQGWPSLSA